MARINTCANKSNINQEKSQFTGVKITSSISLMRTSVRTLITKGKNKSEDKIFDKL